MLNVIVIDKDQNKIPTSYSNIDKMLDSNLEALAKLRIYSD